MLTASFAGCSACLQRGWAVRLTQLCCSAPGGCCQLRSAASDTAAAKGYTHMHEHRSVAALEEASSVGGAQR